MCGWLHQGGRGCMQRLATLVCFVVWCLAGTRSIACAFTGLFRLLNIGLCVLYSYVL